MCNEMKILFQNMKPYIDKCAVIDIVETKFGLLMVENVGRRELCIEPMMIESYDELLRILFQNIRDDIMEKRHIREVDEQVARELRYLVSPYLAGLQDELYAFEQLDVFIAEQFE